MFKKLFLCALMLASTAFGANAQKEGNMSEIYLAGGCFWGMQGYFDKLKGVQKSVVGYANGDGSDTSYERIKKTGHAETLHLIYDSAKISLDELLAHFWRVIDPYSINKQGNDVGVQYRSGVYYTSNDDESVIRAFFDAKQKADLNRKIAVQIAPLENFVIAEEYHQKYLQKNPNGYCHIDLSMADEPLHDESKYKVPSKDELKAKLSPLAYEVTQNRGTERAGTSELDKHYEKGIYVDVVTKKPLFASTHKFNSGSGWPSFSEPITPDALKYASDTSHGMRRTEVSSKLGGAHLGHVFNDGPKDMGGLRYCINGAALEFVPYEQMDAKGYSEYKRYVK